MEKGKFSAVVPVLAAVARELAKQAMDSMPKLQEDEVIQREWYEDGIYYRETSCSTHLYDFRSRECRIAEVKSA